MSIHIDTSMIAPCGMNCALCIGYIRDRNPCAGCHGPDDTKPKHCAVCRIKNCGHLSDSGSPFCFACDIFPCARVKQLDKRYRTKYGMSMIENLRMIETGGLESFVRREEERWECPECGGLLSVHRDSCPFCGSPKAEQTT